MSSAIYQILYCSRNKMQGGPDENESQIADILQASRKNNATAGVTGALFFNSLLFAQVLEGRFSDVQRIFERLQLDPRHSDLVVLQSGFVNGRDFGDWSMAYAGVSSDRAFPFVPRELANSPETPQSGDRVVQFLRQVVLEQETWALPERPSPIRAGASR